MQNSELRIEQGILSSNTLDNKKLKEANVKRAIHPLITCMC